MGARGFSSSAAGNVTVLAGGLGQRPAAPGDLTADQKTIWKETVESEGADFFNTAALRAMLKDYCLHKSSAADLNRQIRQYDAAAVMDPETARAFERLLKMRRDETKEAADLATKLRLTNQSRYTPKAAATAAKHNSTGRKPWETQAG